MDTIVIQWYVNKWPGILKFSVTYSNNKINIKYSGYHCMASCANKACCRCCCISFFPSQHFIAWQVVQIKLVVVAAVFRSSPRST